MGLTLLCPVPLFFFYSCPREARLKPLPLTRSPVKGRNSHFPHFHLGVHIVTAAILKADRFTLVNKLTKEGIWQMLGWKRVSWKRGLWNTDIPHEGCNFVELGKSASSFPTWQDTKRPSSSFFYLTACFFPGGNRPFLGDSPFSWVNGNSASGLVSNYKKRPSIYFSSLGTQQNQLSCLIYEDWLFYLQVESKQSYLSFCTVGKPVPSYNGHKWALLINYHIF